MTIQQCKYLVEIQKYHSICKAAEALFVTQPTISKAIKELEQELEMRILVRNSHGVTFTAEGEELLSYAKGLIEQEQHIIHRFRNKKYFQKLQLNISSQQYGFAVEAFAKTMEYLRYTSYELALLEGSLSDIISDVSAGISVLGVTSYTDFNRDLIMRTLADRNLVFTRLMLAKYCVFVRKEHPLAGETSLSIDQLRYYPYLTCRKNDVSMDYSERFIDLNNTTRTVYLNDRGSLNNLIANTDGYNLGTGAIIPDYMNPNIISIPLKDEAHIHIGYITRKDQGLSPEVQYFIDELRASLQRAISEDCNLISQTDNTQQDT